MNPLPVSGFRLIKCKSGIFSGYSVDLAKVVYTPLVKHKVERSCAFDPTIRIKRDPFHEDLIECSFTPDDSEYSSLISFLTDCDSCYIEFNSSSQRLQLPVDIDRLPQLPDELRYIPTEIKLSFKSVYRTYAPADFDTLFGFGSSYGSSYGL